MKIANDKATFTPTQIYKNINAKEDFVYLSSVLGANAIVVNGDDTEVLKLPFVNDLPVILKAENTGKMTEGGNVKRYLFITPKNGEYKLAIERLFLNSSDLQMEVDGTKVSDRLIKQNDSLVVVETT
jgi:hypothetical protein